MERLVLTCRLCKHHTAADVLAGIRADMTEEAAKTETVGRLLRAEREFFQNHWQQAHPAQAEEIIQHITAVEQLARVTSYHKRVFDTRFEEP